MLARLREKNLDRWLLAYVRHAWAERAAPRYARLALRARGIERLGMRGLRVAERKR